MNRSFSSSALAQLIATRVLEFVREPEALFWGFAFPILLAAGLGLAFRSSGPQALKVAASDLKIADRLRREKSLDVEPMPAGIAETALHTGRIALTVSLDARGVVVYRYDDTNPEGKLARLLAGSAIQSGSAPATAIASADDILREPGSRYVDFLVPGLLGMTLMGTSLWGMGFAIVDARKRKLLRRLIATPMPRTFYLLSFGVSHLIIVAAEVFVLVGVGNLMFHVPVRGAILDLALICIAGNLCFSAIGLLIASRTQTVEGASGLTNLVMLPMWICSGVFFSAQRFPDLLQPVLRRLPLTALIDALRRNMLEGAGLMQLTPELLLLMSCFAICFGLALRTFKWR
jgi:ABC-type multidrug transport system permease subunit